MNPVNLPTPLRWSLRGGVIEILVIRLQESIVNLIELVVEHLLWELVAVRSSVSAKQNPVLMLVKESPRRSRLASQLANARRNVDVHVTEAVQIF